MTLEAKGRKKGKAKNNAKSFALDKEKEDGENKIVPGLALLNSLKEKKAKLQREKLEATKKEVFDSNKDANGDCKVNEARPLRKTNKSDLVKMNESPAKSKIATKALKKPPQKNFQVIEEDKPVNDNKEFAQVKKSASVSSPDLPADLVLFHLPSPSSASIITRKPNSLPQLASQTPSLPLPTSTLVY